MLIKLVRCLIIKKARHWWEIYTNLGYTAAAAGGGSVHVGILESVESGGWGLRGS